MRALQVTSRGHGSRILRRGLGLAYAEPGGGPVRRGETSWKKVNGIWLNTPFGCAWLLFRRWP